MRKLQITNLPRDVCHEIINFVSFSEGFSLLQSNIFPENVDDIKKKIIPKDICSKIIQFVGLPDAFALLESNIFPENVDDIKKKAIKYNANCAVIWKKNFELFNTRNNMMNTQKTDRERISAMEYIEKFISDEYMFRENGFSCILRDEDSRFMNSIKTDLYQCIQFYSGESQESYYKKILQHVKRLDSIFKYFMDTVIFPDLRFYLSFSYDHPISLVKLKYFVNFITIDSTYECYTELFSGRSHSKLSLPYELASSMIKASNMRSWRRRLNRRNIQN